MRRFDLGTLLPIFGLVLGAACSPNGTRTESTTPPAAVPRYLPSAFSESPVDILSEGYGAFGGAPQAPGLGASVADFTLPLAHGDSFSLADARQQGDVVVVFFRGFW